MLFSYTSIKRTIPKLDFLLQTRKKHQVNFAFSFMNGNNSQLTNPQKIQYKSTIIIE